ncbi:PhzF family phenazine biosynthesis protein [Acinetobacter sp. ANC 4641]|uniref:PhzF family phenazine biosynthesis protein n=1 Tax=Acinetobacter sp. ANC 4641 TaxID=2529847 RepID=UPI00103DFA32|nr:PhzF family phenazine biosynthesis protein [Acinetobacter sp. ANC 4641]TCB06992.1 PhzF family phenazine biosynthesis protein [Acinetobacter sp. ANC 4641]
MKIYQVDAFSQKLFQGNPAAVIVQDEWLSDALMQNIALENNLSETAFVKRIDDTHYAIRWFTPTAEVAFCGHATLASAFVLFREYTQSTEIEFEVKNLGTFYVSHAADGKINMNFPIRKPEYLKEYPEILNEALNKPIQAVYVNPQAYVIELESAQDVLDLEVDFLKLKALGHAHAAMEVSSLDVAVTASYAGESTYDCISRYFAPEIGIDEDPVTGSIHTAIVPLWAEKLGKTELVAYQASARGGELFCRILNAERMEVSGYAKLYMIGELFV